MIPVSSRGESDPKLKNIWLEGVQWGLQLLAYLRPQLLILNGNGPKSAWAMIEKDFGITHRKPFVYLGRNFHLKEGYVHSGPFAGARVIGLPHLSRDKASMQLKEALVSIGPYD